MSFVFRGYCGMAVRGPTGVGAHVGQLGAHYGSVSGVSTPARRVPVVERQPVVAWARGQVCREVLTHRDLTAEARAASHFRDGQVGPLQQLLSCGDALGD